MGGSDRTRAHRPTEASGVRELLAAIIDSTDDAILTKDLNGIVTSWNHAAQLLYGYTAEEMIGKPVTLLIPDDRHDEEPSILARIRKGERVESYDTVRRRKDGSLVGISLTSSPLKGGDGKVLGVDHCTRRHQKTARDRETEAAAAGNAPPHK